MIKNDIVGLLPDLRAFSRFLCREREAADDLVQNTILAALDKQAQFAPGTNLKGWLFTIMRNRFYSDLRTQRRRPTSIDDEAACTAGGGRQSGSHARLEGTVLGAVAAQPAIARGTRPGGRRWFLLRGGRRPLRLFDRHPEGPGVAGAQAARRPAGLEKHGYFNALQGIAEAM